MGGQKSSGRGERTSAMTDDVIHRCRGPYIDASAGIQTSYSTIHKMSMKLMHISEAKRKEILYLESYKIDMLQLKSKNTGVVKGQLVILLGHLFVTASLESLRGLEVAHGLPLPVEPFMLRKPGQFHGLIN